MSQPHCVSGGGPRARDRFLVAVDVDGTLLNTESEDDLRPREIAAIAAVVAAGHVVALCTGRNSRSVESLLERSGDRLRELPLILLNGAVIIGGQPRRLLRHTVLDGGTVRRLVEIFRAHDTVAMIYDTEDRHGVLYYEDRQPNSILGRYLAKRRLHVGAIEAVADLLEHIPETALEVGTIDRKERIWPLSDDIRRELGDRVQVINTQSMLEPGEYFWAEVYHQDCGKGQAAVRLAEEYGIPTTRIIALGDNYNDLALFERARFRVAMGNAPVEVRAAADLIAPPVSESGAAVILEKIAAGSYPQTQAKTHRHNELS